MFRRAPDAPEALGLRVSWPRENSFGFSRIAFYMARPMCSCLNLEMAVGRFVQDSICRAERALEAVQLPSQVKRRLHTLSDLELEAHAELSLVEPALLHQIVSEQLRELRGRLLLRRDVEPLRVVCEAVHDVRNRQFTWTAQDVVAAAGAPSHRVGLQHRPALEFNYPSAELERQIIEQESDAEVELGPQPVKFAHMKLSLNSKGLGTPPPFVPPS